MSTNAHAIEKPTLKRAPGEQVHQDTPIVQIALWLVPIDVLHAVG